jgi:SAM-dependent methyltransferase
MKTKMLFRRKYSENICIFCDSQFISWKPYRGGEVSPVILTLEAIGSDIERFYCPVCECFDRERHLMMYFSELSLWEKIENSDVLHIAAESNFGRIVSSKSKSYVKGDLSPADDSVVKVDLTETSFRDGQFDVLIANHVLEHILDDISAMREINRILRVGGIAILQTPYSPLIKESLESPSLRDEPLRNFLFGQEDHVRLYGLDLFERLNDSDLDVKLYSHERYLARFDPAKYGVNGMESLILVTKRVASTS